VALVTTLTTDEAIRAAGMLKAILDSAATSRVWTPEVEEAMRLADELCAAVPPRRFKPGWLFVGDYPPAFLAAVAGHLGAHEDLDVQEIGARMRAAGGAG
jgi:uncharacterized protein YbjT (DUF2867 family)